LPLRELGNLIERLVLLTDHTRVTAVAVERFMPESSPPAPGAVDGPRASAPQAASGPAPDALVRDYQSANSHTAEHLRKAGLR